jgi:hypothetical protein
MLDEQTKRAATDPVAEQRASRGRWGTVKKTPQHFPLGKTEIYEFAREHPELLRKWGRKTLVDWDFLDKIMDALPPAELRPIASIHTEEVLARRERSKQRFYAQRRKKRERAKDAGREVA